MLCWSIYIISVWCIGPCPRGYGHLLAVRLPQGQQQRPQRFQPHRGSFQLYGRGIQYTVQYSTSTATIHLLKIFFLPQEYRFPSLSQSFSTLFHNDPLQRIRIIVRYARFEPSTSAPEVWCVVCFSICLFICFFMVLYLIYYNKILNDAMSSLPHSTIIKF